MIEAIIFDLDGVIVDTAKYHYQAWKNLAMMMGFEFSEKDNERLKGVSRMESLSILLELGRLSFDEETKIKLAEFKNEEYVGSINTMTADEILPGVIEFLNEVQRVGLKTAIGSASQNTPLILERVGLSGFFDAVVDGNTVSKAKPDPEIFLQAARALNVDPLKCLVFEDAEAGVEAALRAGMKCIGVGSSKTLAKAHGLINGFEGLTIKMLNDML